MIGSTLGPYEIQRQLGVGGMGEVYLAEDARLGRKVAIKVLPAQFASDAERLARFEQEARAAAALNHPNIAVLHDIGAEMGDDDTVHFIVQEALEGQSLGERLTGGPIPMEEALRYATGLADGLAAAHVAGVVHRDLKPDNVFLIQDGQIKILDFGLAKLTQADPAGGGSGSVSMSPTSLGTVAGQPMGTAAYMSPEQARGETVDQRTDVWAFGVVLFEMLTGERLFRADSISDTVAAVLRDPIDLAKLPEGMPHEVRRLLGRCLERDARRRLHHLADARIEIEDALSSGPLGAASSGAARPGASADSTATAPPPTTATTRPLWTRALSWIGLVALGVVIATAFEPDPSGNATDPSTMRLTVHLSPGMGLDTGGGRAVAISSDGSRLAFVAGGQLHVRFLDRREARPLAQDNNAIMPFFSSDGEWIGFFTGREMKKVSVSGGTPLTITTVPQPRGGAWVGDTIVYAPDTVGGLWTIAADGSGDPTPLTTLEGEERSHRWPSPMGDEHVVFAAQTIGRTYGESTIKVASLRDGVVHEVHNGGAFPAYAASGHLLLIQESTLFAAPFDLDSLMVTGPITPVVQGVLAQSGGEQVHNGSAQYVVSDNGTLVYSPDLGFGADRAMFYVDDDGDRERVPQEPRAYASPRFSPDGRYLGAHISNDTGSDVWVIDLERGTQSRITSVGNGILPVFHPDGETLAYAATAPGTPFSNVYIGRVNEPGTHRQLTAESANTMPRSFSPDGSSLAVMMISPEAGWDVGVVNVDDGTLEILLQSPASERHPEFSPDGRWIAFASDQTGRLEIHVMRVDGTGERTVSTEGGTFPRWAPDGSELYWRDANRMMAARVDTEADGFVHDPPRELFVTSGTGIGDFAMFDVQPDGDGFLLLQTDAGPEEVAFAEQVRMVFDFFATLSAATTDARAP